MRVTIHPTASQDVRQLHDDLADLVADGETRPKMSRHHGVEVDAATALRYLSPRFGQLPVEAPQPLSLPTTPEPVVEAPPAEKPEAKAPKVDAKTDDGAQVTTTRRPRKSAASAARTTDEVTQ